MEESLFSKYIESIELDNKLFGEDVAFEKASIILKNGYYHTNVVSPFFTKFSKDRVFSYAQMLHNDLTKNGIRNWSDEEESLRISGIDKGIPPIMIVSLPKSGSVYIQENLSRTLNIPHIQISLARLPNDYILEEALKIFSKGGAVSQTHLDAKSENLDLLFKYGIRNIHVHVRDPRQATISWQKYISNEMVGEFSHRRHLVDPPLPKNFDAKSEIEKIEWFAMNHFPGCLRWIGQWVSIAHNDTRFSVTFSDHQSLRTNNVSFISELADRFGVQSHFSVDKVSHPEVGKAHFRQGRNNEWKEEIPDDIRAWMEYLMPKILIEKFRWST